MLPTQTSVLLHAAPVAKPGKVRAFTRLRSHWPLVPKRTVVPSPASTCKPDRTQGPSCSQTTAADCAWKNHAPPKLSGSQSGLHTARCPPLTGTATNSRPPSTPADWQMYPTATVAPPAFGSPESARICQQQAIDHQASTSSNQQAMHLLQL